MVSRGKTSARTVPQGVDGISARVEGENAGDGQPVALEAKEGESVGNSGDSSGTREDKAVLLAEHAGASVFHADWRALLDVVPECDAVLVDAPYSERTHAAYQPRSDADYANDNWEANGGGRRAINYTGWSAADVAAFVESWHPRCAGWFVSITDHGLAPAWSAALERAGRYVFSPIAFVAPGSRVRLVGDGPSQWSTWIVAARPRHNPYAKWGTLPGAYVLPTQERMAVVGGKPLWLMERLVEDYTRPGALVVDPCCGAGTTLVAAQRTGRRAIGGDAMREHAEIAAKRISKPAQAPLWVPGSNEVSHATQSQLFDEGEQGK